MKQFLFVLIVNNILIYMNLNAQWHIATLPTDFYSFQRDSLKFENQVSIYGDYSFQSNTITNKFASALYKGEYLDSLLKQSVSNKLSANNRFGVRYNYGILYERQSKKIKWWLGCHNRFIVNGLFTNDMFTTVFYGNAVLSGKEAQLAPLNVNIIGFQQMGGGVKMNLEKHHFGVGVYFLNGAYGQRYTLSTATLFTASDGSYIEADFAYDISLSDTNKALGLSSAGWGISSDLFYEFNINDKNKISLSAFDVGLIKWNNLAVQSSFDTSLFFSGVTVDNIFDLLDTANNDGIADSIVSSFMPRYTSANYTTVLPTHLSLAYASILSENIILYGSITYKILANYIPSVQFGGNFQLPYISIDTQLGYGAYGKFSALIGLNTHIKFITLRVMAFNPHGYIFSEKVSGQGLQAIMQLRF